MIRMRRLRNRGRGFLYGRMIYPAIVAAAILAAGNTYALDFEVSQFWDFVGPPYAIHQTRDGVIWIGNQVRLMRWDGVERRIYSPSALDPESLPGWVSALYEDPSGRLWVGGEYLARFNDGAFERIKADSPTGELGYVRTILDDEAGTVWIGADSGLYRLSDDGERLQYVSLSLIDALLLDSDGRLWIAADDGVFILADDGEAVPFRNSNGELPFAGLRAKDLELGVDDTILVAAEGLWAVDIKTQVSTPWTATDPAGNSILESLYDVYVYSEDFLLLSAPEAGIYSFELATGEVRKIWFPGEEEGDAVESHRFWRGLSGTTFIDTNLNVTGVFTVREKTNAISIMSAPDGPTGFVVSTDGTVWGISENGVGAIFRVDLDTLITEIVVGPGTHPELFGEGSIRGFGLIAGKNNSLWATWDNKIVRYYPNTDEFEFHPVLPEVPTDEMWLGDLGFDSIGRLWMVAAFGKGGLFSYDPESDSLTRFQYDTDDPDDPQSLSFEVTFTSYVDSRDRVWILYYSGMDLLDINTSSIVARFRPDANAEYPIPYAFVADMAEDREGRYWFAAVGGIFRMDDTTFEIEDLGLSDGLPTATFSEVVIDEEGYVWVASLDSVAVRIEPETLAFDIFGKESGVLPAFGMDNGLLTPDGRILWGAQDRIVVVDPAAVALSEGFYFISLSQMRYSVRGVDDAVVDFASDSIRIPWRQNRIEFDYLAIDYSNPQAIRYQYKLIGFSDEWIDHGSGRTVAFSNLAGGDYEFVVRHRNGAGGLGPEDTWRRVTFRVEQNPFIATGAIILYSLAFVVVVALVVFGLTTRQRKQLALQQREARRERDAREKLEQLDHLKDAFLANTSHELRTPLHGMVGLAESLLSGVAGEVAPLMQSNLSMIVASGRRLTNLVNDILDFSKIREGDLHLGKKSVDVRVLVDLCLPLLLPLSSRKNLELKNEVPTDMQLVDADPDRLQQILMNLIGNAVKFTPEGTVGVSAKYDGNRVFVSVSDTGVGIPEAGQEAIFRSFEQLDGTAGREYGGTGLGLTVSRQLVELHGGRIVVDSEENRGSVFTFDLPVADNQTAPNDGPSVARLAPAEYSSPVVPATSITSGNAYARESIGETRAELKILVVDDEPINLQVVANHLAAGGYQVLQADNGEQALQMTRSEKPDLVLLDIMMPRMNGYEVCESIRREYPAAETPVIMLTARNQVSDLVHGFGAGANDYIAKPFNKEELLARIKTHLELAKINIAYGNFVPREFLEQLEKESILDVRLGDQVSRSMSIMFSDIRGFAGMSENLTPEKTFHLINDYLKEVVPPIREHGGFVDKFIGDGIMALFPGDAESAVAAALDMQSSVDSFNAKRNGPPIGTGIGIHTGDLILGTIGVSSRMEETVISDAVNVASRIEGLSKLFGARILMSQATLDGIAPDRPVPNRFLGRVAVKGRQDNTAVYQVLVGGDADLKEQTHPDFQGALDAYYRKDFDTALGAFAAVLKLDPGDMSAALYRKRAAQLITNPPPADWDGVERPAEK